MTALEIPNSIQFSTETQKRAMVRVQELLGDPLVCPGGHLPSERELAEHVGVSRPTLRLVLQGMERAGFIRIFSGKKRVGTLPASQPVMSDRTVAVLWHVEDPSVPGRHPAPGWSHHTRFGMTQALQARGDNVMLLHPQSLIGKPPDWICDAGFLGLIVDEAAMQSAPTRELVLRARAEGMAVVTYGDEPWMRPLDRVISDHREGTRAMTRALIAEGRRNILRVWHRSTVEAQPPAWLSERNAGYEQAMQDAGLQPLPAVTIACDFTEPLEDASARLERDARLTTGYLVDRLAKGPNGGPVDALMAVSDGTVTTVRAACRLLNIQPEHMVVTGYDNYWQDTSERQFEPVPPIMTVDKLNREIGRVAVQLLHDRREGRLPPEPQRRVVASKLITGSPAGQSVVLPA